MTAAIRKGDRATARGPLKPTGQIRVGDKMFAAKSVSGWVDADADVEIVGGSMRQIVVRIAGENCEPVGDHGEALPQGDGEPAIPIQAPSAWVETIRATRIGAGLGVLVAVAIWIQGTPISLSALSLPLAGAASGWGFRKLVGLGVEVVPPYSDHRPIARGLAVVVLFAILAGGVIGFILSGTFIGTSAGLMLGTITIAIGVFVVFMLAHIV